MPDEICDLARELPIATLGEARHCKTDGVLIDYHLDRKGSPSDLRLIAGPDFAPIDPRFAGAGRAGPTIDRILISVGGSKQALAFLDLLQQMAHKAFPSAEQVVLRAGDSRSQPTRLRDVVGDVDLGVGTAGLTAYELACAGVPQVAIAIAENQRRVLQGLRSAGIACCVDVLGGESLEGITACLDSLSDPEVRREQVRRGLATFDGHGAERAVDALLERWRPPADGSRCR